MNPPSALYGAMNKDRKPFTYTPGGLDLSEIKSERMAKRLMRNAMSEGVPEIPAQSLQSAPAPVTPNAIPNFNCLPVQVFPSFPLPANPKSLLRTRSIPDPLKEASVLSSPTSTLPDEKFTWRDINNPLSFNVNNNNICNTNNNRPASAYDYKTLPDRSPLYQRDYGSSDHTELLLPEKSYDAEYCQMEPQGRIKVIKEKNNVVDLATPDSYGTTLTQKTDNDLVSLQLQDKDASSNYEQKEVKVVKKQSKTENKTEQNGDSEASLVVKLPSKTSAAKTETKVEVLKKILPDGSIEEVKTTTTKTTKDGKTEITTETETRTIPKEGTPEVIEVEEEETENIVEEHSDEPVTAEESKEEEKNEVKKSIENGEAAEESEEEEISETVKTEVKENGHIITGEEKTESSTTKKVVVIQSTGNDSEEDIEEEVEEEEEENNGDVEVEEVVILKKPENKQNNESENKNIEISDSVEEVLETSKEEEPEDKEEEEIEDEEVNEEEEEEEVKIPVTEEPEKIEKEEENSDAEEEPVEKKGDNEEESKNLIDEDAEEEFEEAEDTDINKKTSETVTEQPTGEKDEKAELKTDAKAQHITNDISEEIPASIETNTSEPQIIKEEIEKPEVREETVHKIPVQLEPKVSFREPSIPLEKVEDIEIKPIAPAQEIIKKSHTEIIKTTTDKPAGALSTQTEYNRIENIVTVNRSTKTLDAYEPSQPTIPTLKTYFSPINDRVLSTPQPTSRPYQPIYPPESQGERRHSLLLDRLSVDRQIPPPDINQYSNQSYEQNQWSEGPQSEVLTVSNVKPSTITKNQQWYQQTTRENVTSNTAPSIPPSQLQQQWEPPYQQRYHQPQPQAHLQPETHYQNYTQPQFAPKQEYQPYIDKSTQNTYKSADDFQQNTYPSYTPKPSWVSNTYDSKPANLAPLSQSNQYSTIKKDSTENYQKTTQQFSSTYVPPPWEQDSSYITESQNYYQPPPSATSFSPSVNQTWKPQKSANKFTKPPPTAYIPPAPNQSFVKPVTSNDQSKIPGRKTYYSEYERRYISVPESTYIPTETKFQAQPDPSPQYYYDNIEPVETVEPQWRKELREFTEKTSETTTHYENTSVRPPWEEDLKYAAPAPADYSATVTPSWTQTLRPCTWRERSYEPEYIGSKEWPKTNTLGRGRPQSSYIKSNVEPILERSRGVSVDRYNPNNYQSPLSSEHPPVQTHTLNPTVHPKTYHNPNVPAYHARGSAETREQVTYPQPRRAESRAPPVQSRSFKYLQWITGTED